MEITFVLEEENKVKKCVANFPHIDFVSASGNSNVEVTATKRGNCLELNDEFILGGKNFAIIATKEERGYTVGSCELDLLDDTSCFVLENLALDYFVDDEAFSELLDFRVLTSWLNSKLDELKKQCVTFC